MIAGVSADTYLLGSRNPFTGKIEGFDIDMVKAIAKAIFGDENKYELRVITAAQRIPVAGGRRRRHGRPEHDHHLRPLEPDRLLHRVLRGRARRSWSARVSKATTLADLAGQRVCAPKGTSSMDNLMKLAPEGDRRSAPTTTPAAWCCSRRVRSTRSPATTRCWPASPPRTRTPSSPTKAFTAEPYGIGINSRDVDLVRFVNGVLAEMRSDGEWKRIYNRWLAEAARSGPGAAQGRLRQDRVIAYGGVRT